MSDIKPLTRVVSENDTAYFFCKEPSSGADLS